VIGELVRRKRSARSTVDLRITTAPFTPERALALVREAHRTPA
jgi:hypothetical protein